MNRNLDECEIDCVSLIVQLKNNFEGVIGKRILAFAGLHLD